MSDDGMKITLGRPGSVRLQTDPVCGMKVDPATARGGKHEHAGQTYWFCNPRCRDRFAADPEHWLKAGPSMAAMSAPGIDTTTATVQAMLLFRFIALPNDEAQTPRL